LFYHFYEYSHRLMSPLRAVTEGMRLAMASPLNPISHTTVGRSALASLEVFERTTRRYGKPAFDLPTTKVGDREVAVTEQIVWEKPFCRLIHFKRAVEPSVAKAQPKVLIVAPMSGHYATLLRGTVEAFLPEHEVYITDWIDARDVPAADANFDLDDYVDYMMDMFRHLKGDCHVFAVCQPSVPVMAAIARMEATGDAHVPHSVTLAGGPVDTRKSPTQVNALAVDNGTDWFARNVINNVPWPNRGFGRKVYPGFLQLSGFMSMNLDKHMKAHKDLFVHLVDGDGDSVEKHKEFYDEYLAVMDLTAEFYMQTIEKVFVEHQLPRGLYKHRGAPVDLSKIKRVALMTVEGEKDDITGRGQCSAAIDLCSGIPAARKQHFECPKVGHYGVFAGSRFRSEIAPRMRHFMRRNDPRTKAGTAAEYKPALSVVGGKAEKVGRAEQSAFTFGKDAALNPAPAVRANSADFDPFLPFSAFTPSGALSLWSMTTDVMISSFARMNGGAAPRAVAQKPD
jgi:poly(3-hydroxybutyrate) depolymerase